MGWSRILLSVSPSPASGAAFVGSKWFDSGRRRFGLRPDLRFHANGPDETEKFPADGGDDLWFALARRSQFLIARVQTMLRLPGNFFDVVGQILLASA